MLFAVSWARGVRPGPITGRNERPVTVEVAVAEWWAALTAADGVGARPPPLEKISAELGVAYWPLDERDSEWAYGVWLGLGLLLGARGHEQAWGRLSPGAAGGRVPSAADLYQLVTADDPVGYIPERHTVLRDRLLARLSGARPEGQHENV